MSTLSATSSTTRTSGGSRIAAYRSATDAGSPLTLPLRGLLPLPASGARGFSGSLPRPACGERVGVRGALRRIMPISQASLGIRQEFADFGEELARAEGLGDVAVAAGFAGLGLVARQRVGGDGDDRHLRQLGDGADPARRLVAVDDRQLDIHQDQV